MPRSCSLAHILHFSHPTQSMMCVMLWKVVCTQTRKYATRVLNGKAARSLATMLATSRLPAVRHNCRTCSCCFSASLFAPFHRRPSSNGMGHAVCSVSLFSNLHSAVKRWRGGYWAAGWSKPLLFISHRKPNHFNA